jgi:hypothetical protein
VGLLREGTGNVGNCDVNTNGNGGGVGRCKEVDGDIEGVEPGVVGQALGWLSLDIVFRAYKIGKGGEQLQNGEESVTNVVVERRFVALGEATREKVVAMAVYSFFAKGAPGWRSGGVKDGEAQFAADQKAVDVRGESMVLEAAGREWRGIPVVSERREGRMSKVGSGICARKERKVRD